LRYHRQNVVVEGRHQQVWSVDMTPQCASSSVDMSICPMMHFSIYANWQNTDLVLSGISSQLARDESMKVSSAEVESFLL